MARISPDRRTVLKATAGLVGAGALAGCLGGGGDEEYPSREITGVIPFGAGGSTDVLSREFYGYWEDELGVSITADNRPGAGGRIGTNYLNNQDPDGYTVETISLPTAVLGEIVADTEYTFNGDDALTPIGTINDRPTAFCTAPDRFDDFAAFVDWAQDETHTYASPGTGTSVDFAYSVMMDNLDCEFDTVTYDDSTEQLTAVARGDTDTCYLDPVIANSFQEDGRVDVLLVGLRDTTHPAVPDVPIFDDFGILDGIPALKYQLAALAPPGLPDDVLGTLESTLVDAAGTDGYRADAEEAGLIVRGDGNDATWDLIEDIQTGGEQYLNLLERQGRDLYPPESNER